MSDINLEFTIDQLQTVVTVEQNSINFTPEVIDLRLFAGGYATPSGNAGELQYNNNGILGANAGMVYNPLSDVLTLSTNTTSISNLVATAANVTGTATISTLNVIGNSNIANMTATGNINANNISATNYSNASIMNATTGNITTINASNINTSNLTTTGTANLGSVSNLKISGGSANYVLATDGLGNLSWGNVQSTNYAGYAGNVVNANQPNITSLGNLTSLTVVGNVAFAGGANISLGPSSNLEITGGLNGYFLQTDGTGNLTWAAAGNVTGNGVPGGANTQIQFNDGGNFGGAAGFTFDTSSNAMAVPGNIASSGNITATNNITATGNITGNYINGIHNGPVINLPYGIETLSLIGAQSGTYNIDLLNDSIRYTTANASANVTLNYRANSTVTLNTLLGNGQSIVSTYVLRNGSNAYSVSNVQIDGTTQTLKWVNGVVPIAVANGLNAYTFTIVKTSTTPTYDVLASITRYT